MASAEKIRCKVTDTKQDILKAYKTHLEELNARSEGSLDPAKVQTEKKQVETLQRVEKVAKLDVPATIITLQNNISQTLTGILNTLEERRTELADVEEAVRIKQAELQELYGIEKQAATLAALIESHKKLDLQYDEEHDIKRKQMTEEVAEARKAFETQRKAWIEEISALKANDMATRKREAEEYNYKFEREKQMRLDTLNDEIAKKNNEIAKRIEEVTARESNMKILETKVIDLEAKILTETERVRKETEEQCKKSAQTAAQFAQMSHKGEVDRLTSQLEAANSRCNDLLAQNTKLQDALDKANEKVQSIAVEALKSGADAKTIAELRSFESTRSGK